MGNNIQPTTDRLEKAARRASGTYSAWLRQLRVAAYETAKKHGAKRAEKLDNHRADLEVYEHSLSVRVRQWKQQRKHSGAVRGEISGYSDRSRNRLIGFLNRVVWPSSRVYFGTLTYPDEFPDNHRQIAVDLDAFSKRLLRAFPGVGVVWRREWVVRKSGVNIGKIAPHYHFFAFNVGVDASEFWNFVRLAWADIIFRYTSERHYLAALEHGTHVREVNSRKHAIYYASKYMVKSAQPSTNLETGELPTVGRAWGYWGKVNASPLVVMALTHFQLTILRQLMEKFLIAAGNMFGFKLAYTYAGWMGFTAFVDAVDFAQFYLKERRFT